MIQRLVCSANKFKPLPEHVIYNSPKAPDTYKMFSTKTGKYEGIMIARPEFVEESRIYPNKKNFWAYYVVGLDAKIKNIGVGKLFEKFLRHLAQKDERCQGRIWLRAFNNLSEHGVDEKGRASSMWWYKQGYRGCDKEAQADLERVLRRQPPKYGDWYRDMDMYLPIKETQK